MKEENLKQLKMALTNHKPMLIELGNNQRLFLKWDEKCLGYRGYSKELDTEIGIWELSWLLQIANGKYKEYELKEIK